MGSHLNLLTGHRRTISHLMGQKQFQFIKHKISEPLTIDGAADDVLHFASRASPAADLAHPISTLEVGALGTHNALRVEGQGCAVPAGEHVGGLRRS